MLRITGLTSIVKPITKGSTFNFEISARIGFSLAELVKIRRIKKMTDKDVIEKIKKLIKERG
jgi:hypothetical protein